MKYSFLMAVNRNNPYLVDAINSVLCQTVSTFDFYIIANNCSDELWELLQGFRDTRIKLFRTTIGQLSFNLNYGLNLIKEGYVLRMDSDDISLPERLQVTQQALSELDYPDILAGEAIVIDGDGNRTGYIEVPNTHAEICRKLWYKNPIVHPSTALRVETIVKLRGYSGGFFSEDGDLWMRASRDGGAVMRGLNHPLIKYRLHGSQARGNLTAYAESAGYRLREFLLGRGFKYLIGTLISVAKYQYRARWR